MKSTAVKPENKPASELAAEQNNVGWRQFPVFEQILASETRPPLLSSVEKTCRELNVLLESGSPPDKTRAKLVMTAYGRSLDLLTVLMQMRDGKQEQK